MTVSKRIIIISILRLALLLERRLLVRRRRQGDARRAGRPGRGSNSLVEAQAGKGLLGVGGAGDAALEGGLADLVLRVAVAVVVDALVHDLVRHQRLDQLVVRCQQPPDVLLALHQLDVAQDLPPQLLADVEAVAALGVVGDTLVLAVDELESVDQIRAGDICGRDCLEQLTFLFLETEWLRFISLVFRGPKKGRR